jgi:hypothetical protein
MLTAGLGLRHGLMALHNVPLLLELLVAAAAWRTLAERWSQPAMATGAGKQLAWAPGIQDERALEGTQCLIHELQLCKRCAQPEPACAEQEAHSSAMLRAATCSPQRHPGCTLPPRRHTGTFHIAVIELDGCQGVLQALPPIPCEAAGMQRAVRSGASE